jgi:hypothetical protein
MRAEAKCFQFNHGASWSGLKIQWYLVPCGFDPLLRDHPLVCCPQRCSETEVLDCRRAYASENLLPIITWSVVVLTQYRAEGVRHDNSKTQSRRVLGKTREGWRIAYQ